MTPDTLTELADRFRLYTDGYRVDAELHPMQQLKLEHSIRVAADARAIAVGMEWSESEINIAEAVGIFHDTARFPQFEQHKSFADADSFDHGDRGAEILRTGSLLDGLDAATRAVILHAVQFHNKKDLPLKQSAYEEQHLRLIRDADRLDIFHVCWRSLHSGQIHKHPELMMNIEFDGQPSDAVLDQFENGSTINYQSMRSMADRFILQLSWIHDLSYSSSMRIIQQRGVLDQFIEVLPVRTDRMMRCFDKTRAYLDAAQSQQFSQGFLTPSA